MLLTVLQDSEEIIDEVIQEEKTLSIYNLIMDGGLGGQIIIAVLVVLLAIAFTFILNDFLQSKQLQKRIVIL